MNDAVTLTVAAGPYADAVLRRVTRAIATQAELPIDRVQDAALVADGILDCVAARRVVSRLRVDGEAVELRVGPVDEDTGHRIVRGSSDVPLGAILRRLSDRLWMDEDELCVRIGPQAATGAA